VDDLALAVAKAETDAFLEAWSVQKAGLKAERRLARQVSSVFADTQQSLLDALHAKGLPDTPEMRAALEKSLEDSMAPLEGVLADAEYLEAEGAAERVRLAAGKAGIHIDAAEGLYNPVDHHFLSAHIFEASAHTMARVSSSVMKTIYDAYDAGKGIKDVAKAVNARFTSLKGYEAKRIARTEVNFAQNYGAYSSMQTYGIEYHKWVTGLDARVRGSDPDDRNNHVILHGQVTRVGDPFQNGLRYPGDRGGSIGEWINCRCTTVPWFPPAGYMAPPGQAYWNENDYVERPSDGRGATAPPKDLRNWEAPHEWVSDEQYAAVNTYTGAGYTDINRTLRGKPLDPFGMAEAEVLETVSYMDEVFANLAPHPAMKVYRGSGSTRIYNACTEGGQISDLGYMSTSKRIGTAQNFTTSGDGTHRVVMEISVPKGKKGLNAEALSKLPEEAEFLLDRGSTLRIDKVVDKIDRHGRPFREVQATLL